MLSLSQERKSNIDCYIPPSSDKHSAFSSAFPIYLFTQRTEQVPDEDPGEAAPETTSVEEETEEGTKEVDEDEAVVEEVKDEKEGEQEVDKTPKMKSVTVDEWIRMNPRPPIWMRDPKDVTDEEYENFYQATFHDFEKPLAWHHFSGDSGSGVSFKAIVYIPSKLDDAYWQNPLQSSSKDFRLMVKRVFITNDLGEDALPKWANWVKAVVDGRFVYVLPPSHLPDRFPSRGPPFERFARDPSVYEVP